MARGEDVAHHVIHDGNVVGSDGRGELSALILETGIGCPSSKACQRPELAELGRVVMPSLGVVARGHIERTRMRRGGRVAGRGASGENYCREEQADTDSSHRP